MKKLAADTFKPFSFGTQVRKSPFFNAALRWGAKGFAVNIHMYIPRDFGEPVQNFWNLVENSILCDVAVERQVQINGPDTATTYFGNFCHNVGIIEYFLQ